MLGYGEAVGHCFRAGGAQSEVPGTLEVTRGYPGLQQGWGRLVLGHPGTAGNRRRAENGVGAHGLDLTWGQGVKGEPWLDLWGGILGLSEAGLGLVMVGSAERPSTGD